MVELETNILLALSTFKAGRLNTWSEKNNSIESWLNSRSFEHMEREE